MSEYYQIHCLLEVVQSVLSFAETPVVVITVLRCSTEL